MKKILFFYLDYITKSIYKSSCNYFILLLLLFTLSGCSLFEPPENPYVTFLRNNPNLTYDVAISKLGSYTNYTDGTSVFVVTWDKRKENTYSEKVQTGSNVSKGKGPTVLTPEYKYVQKTYITGSKIIITFNKSTKVMKDWTVCLDC